MNTFFFFFLLCCFAKAGKKNDASGRKALLRECMRVWVDVWPLSLASSPAPHVTHSLGPNVDQDRKKKDFKVLLWATLTLPTKREEKKAGWWELVSSPLWYSYGEIIFYDRTNTHSKILTVRTPEAILAHAIIAYVMIFISPCSSPHHADICEHEPSVSEFTQL